MENKIDHIPIPRKAKSRDQALQSLKNLCSRAERCSADALRLMRGWGVEDSQALQVLDILQKERYIDDRRYAAAFVRDKLLFSHWGEYKIVGALRAKGITKEIIDETISENMTDSAGKRLMELLVAKRRHIREDNPYKLKARLVRYGVSAGWSISSVIDVVERIVDE